MSTSRGFELQREIADLAVVLSIIYLSLALSPRWIVLFLGTEFSVETLLGSLPKDAHAV